MFKNILNNVEPFYRFKTVVKIYIFLNIFLLLFAFYKLKCQKNNLIFCAYFFCIAIAKKV